MSCIIRPLFWVAKENVSQSQKLKQWPLDAIASLPIWWILGTRSMPLWVSPPFLLSLSHLSFSSYLSFYSLSLSLFSFFLLLSLNSVSNELKSNLLPVPFVLLCLTRENGGINKLSLGRKVNKSSIIPQLFWL